MGTAWAHWSTRAQLARGWSSWWSGVSLGTHGPLLSTRRCPRQPALAPPGLACGWGQSWHVHLSGAQPHFLHLRKESACPPPSEQQGQDYVAEQTTSSVPGKCSATRPALSHQVRKQQARGRAPAAAARAQGPHRGPTSPRSRWPWPAAGAGKGPGPGGPVRPPGSRGPSRRRPRAASQMRPVTPCKQRRLGRGSCSCPMVPLIRERLEQPSP